MCNHFFLAKYRQKLQTDFDNFLEEMGTNQLHFGGDPITPSTILP